MGLLGLSGSLRDFSERLIRLEENTRRNNEMLEAVEGLEERLLRLEENMRHNNHMLQNPMESESYVQLSSKLEALKRRMERLEQEAGSKPAGNALTESSGDAAAETGNSAGSVTETGHGQTYSEIDYFDFENYFRGDRELIKERQKEYLPYFAGKKAVLDLGCGRGEFLELLRENDIPAKGVDLYDEFVIYCQGRGLDVTEADAISYLSQIESADGIFAGQLVEHLSLGQIIELCRLAHEKLEEGGCLILETPNPMSLAIYTHAFYMDPSHQKPVHPYTLQYLAQKAGFAKVEIVFTKASRLAEPVPVIRGEGIENAEEFNKNLQKMAELMYGSQDYAIIAQK